MAKIRARRVIQGIIDRLKLQRESEKVPDEILTKVVPTFDVAEKGVLKVWKDHTDNDSDKALTIPAGQLWKIDFINLSTTTTATVGNRVWRVQVTDNAGDIILDTRSDGVQAASTAYKHHWSWHIGSTDVATSVNMFSAFPMFLKGGWQLRIYDSATVDAAADDMHISIWYEEFTQPSEEN